MTPTEAITALEKALEAVFHPAKEENALAQAMHERDARRYFSAAANPLAIRTLLDAHAGALRDAQALRETLQWIADRRWHDADEAADAARAALAQHQPQQGEQR